MIKSTMNKVAKQNEKKKKKLAEASAVVDTERKKCIQYTHAHLNCCFFFERSFAI